MFLLHKPTQEDVSKFLASQQDLPFSYSDVGATATQPPAGFNVDHNQIQLGTGETVFARAVEALRRWRQFDLGWVVIVPPDQPLAAGTVVAIRAQTLRFWSLSASRIVYVITEREGGVVRFGFAYGTLPDHVEKGEERFLIEHRADDSVWYDIYAFSRPKHPLVKLGAPYARSLQRRFARESLAAMRRAVSSRG